MSRSGDEFSPLQSPILYRPAGPRIRQCSSTMVDPAHKTPDVSARQLRLAIQAKRLSPRVIAMLIAVPWLFVAVAHRRLA